MCCPKRIRYEPVYKTLDHLSGWWTTVSRFISRFWAERMTTWWWFDVYVTIRFHISISDKNYTTVSKCCKDISEMVLCQTVSLRYDHIWQSLYNNVCKQQIDLHCDKSKISFFAFYRVGGKLRTLFRKYFSQHYVFFDLKKS